MKKIIYLTLAIITFNTIALSQENNLPAESIYIHTNSTTFITGESLLYKVYCFENSNNILSSISKIAYIELFNSKGESLSRNKIELNSGVGNNEIFISTNFETGKYKLVGYTSWMQNNSNNKYFETEITIINPFKPFQNKVEKKTPKRFEKIETSNANNEISLVLNKKIFSPRKKIIIDIEKKELKNELGNFSLSVRKLDSLQFNSSTTSNANILNQNVQQASFLPEVRGELLSGRISTENPNKSLINNNVALSFTGEKFDLKIFKTNANGEFHFVLDKNISNTNALLQVLDDETNDYKIILNNPTSILMEKNETEEIYINPNFVNQIEERLISCQILNTYAEQDTISTNQQFVPFYHPNQTDYILDDYKRFPTLKETVIEIIPSVYFKKNNDQYSLHIRDYVTSGDSYGKALVLIDGLMIQNVNELFNYNTKNIYKISVVNKAYVYGSKIFSGLISIITFDKNYTSIPKEIIPFSIERYRSSAKYITPNYENPDDFKRIPDFRYQLLWNPAIKMDQEKSSVEFYTSDIKGNFEIILEGFTNNGKHIVVKEYFSVQ